MEVYEALTQIKPLDEERASKVLYDAGLVAHDFAEYVNQYLYELNITLNNVDVVGLAYAFIAESGYAPKLKDYIYSNYLDTRFDLSSEEATKILAKTPKRKRNDAWEWLNKETT